MCGIVGMVGVSAVNQRIYDALTVLQHRGQDAAGIMTSESGRAVHAQGFRAGARCVPAEAHAQAQGQHGHRPRALPDGRRRQRARCAALLREFSLRHLPRPQRQSDQRARIDRSAGARGSPPSEYRIGLRGAAQRAGLRAAARRYAARDAGRHLCRGQRGISPLPRRLRGRRDGHRPRHPGVPRPERHPPAGDRQPQHQKRHRVDARLRERGARHAGFRDGARRGARRGGVHRRAGTILRPAVRGDGAAYAVHFRVSCTSRGRTRSSTTSPCTRRACGWASALRTRSSASGPITTSTW